jgi:hypothetical protein
MKVDPDIITVVSGLPRSGTSMMMSMLEAGGMQVLTDSLRAADEDNPKGYFELERVKQLANDSSWLVEARGKVVKIVSPLLKHLPPDHQYKIIFMHRKMEEILASQKQMLIRRGEPTDTVSDQKMAEMFRKHLVDVESWLGKQQSIKVCYIDYGRALENPFGCAEIVERFLGIGLDLTRMASIADRALNRQRFMPPKSVLL